MMAPDATIIDTTTGPQRSVTVLIADTARLSEQHAIARHRMRTVGETVQKRRIRHRANIFENLASGTARGPVRLLPCLKGAVRLLAGSVGMPSDHNGAQCTIEAHSWRNRTEAGNPPRKDIFEKSSEWNGAKGVSIANLELGGEGNESREKIFDHRRRGTRDEGSRMKMERFNALRPSSTSQL
jgi:hypothetical protein